MRNTNSVAKFIIPLMVVGRYDDLNLPRIKPVRNVPQFARKKAQGRNEKCACGSEKKYKKCCGK